MAWTLDLAAEARLHALCRALHEAGAPLVLKGLPALRLCYGLNLRITATLAFDCAHDVDPTPWFRAAFDGLDLTVKLPEATTNEGVYRQHLSAWEHGGLSLAVAHRRAPSDGKICVTGGVLAYTLPALIRQALADVDQRTDALDLHAVALLARDRLDEFDLLSRLRLIALASNTSDLIPRFADAYQTDAGIYGIDLVRDLEALVQVSRNMTPAAPLDKLLS